MAWGESQAEKVEPISEAKGERRRGASVGADGPRPPVSPPAFPGSPRPKHLRPGGESKACSLTRRSAAKEFAPLVPQQQAQTSDGGYGFMDGLSSVPERTSESRILPALCWRGRHENQSSLASAWDEALLANRKSRRKRVAFGDTDVISFDSTPSSSQSPWSPIYDDEDDEDANDFQSGKHWCRRRGVPLPIKPKPVLLISPRFANLWRRKERSAVLLPHQTFQASELGTSSIIDGFAGV